MAEQRYRVVDRLEAGGMAEVFRGEAVSVQGFRKEVAIKRVLPHLAQNQNFIAMFLDEARLGARLNHANIVSVNDIGSADNTYFIVMEFVDGANLKHLVEHYRKRQRPFPLKEAVFLAAEVCRGLSYAHELTDSDASPLGIVHRDVSPPNILLSKRGEVKVTDFGLAKAKTQLEKTDPGVVKGKFSYLSPEAAMGLAVDSRADLFALGIVLWEMLAGRRLFLGETDYQTVKLVQQANVPDLERLHPEVDDELAALVGRALAKDRDARFQSAREMGDALAGYLFSHKLKVTSYDIAAMVKETLAERAKQKRAPQQSIIDRLISEELLRFTSLDQGQDESPDPNDEGREPLSPESLSRSEGSDGAAALDPGEFENPAEWFDADGEAVETVGDDAFAPPASQRPPAAAAAWREGGIESGEPVPAAGGRPADAASQGAGFDRGSETHQLLEEVGAALGDVEHRAMEERPTRRRTASSSRLAAVGGGHAAAQAPPPPAASSSPPPLPAARPDATRRLSAVERAARNSPAQGTPGIPRAAPAAPPPAVDRFSEPPPRGIPGWLLAIIAFGLVLVGAGVAWLMS